MENGNLIEPNAQPNAQPNVEPNVSQRTSSLPSQRSLDSIFHVFTDGMSVHSGTKSHLGVYSVWIDDNHPENNAWWTKEGTITNQSMELAGVNAGLHAIQRLNATSEEGLEDFERKSIDLHIPLRAESSSSYSRSSRVKKIIYSSSHYVMNCMTKWLPRWERTGWITKQKRAVHNGGMLRNMAEIAHAHEVEFARVPPELLNDDQSSGSSPLYSLVDPFVLRGMRNARRALSDAANEGSHSGCVKQRGAITCVWSGG